MTEIEEKSLKAQVELAKEIISCDSMIITLMNDEALSIYNRVISKKEYIAPDQKIVEFSIDEFQLIKDMIIKLKSNDGMRKINNYIEKNYILPRHEKYKILSKL